MAREINWRVIVAFVKFVRSDKSSVLIIRLINVTFFNQRFSLTSDPMGTKAIYYPARVTSSGALLY